MQHISLEFNKSMNCVLPGIATSKASGEHQVVGIIVRI